MERHIGKLDLLGGGHLHYERIGTSGAGRPTLMLVAGLGGVGSYWEPVVETFAATHEVVLHDHRGTGQ